METMFLTASEAADVLRVHVETLYRLVKAGEVPARKVGKRWLFTRADLASVGSVPSVPVVDDWRSALRATNPYDTVVV